MYHAHPTTSRSAADDLRAYGLTGIELRRASQRREVARRHDQTASALHVPTRLTSARQWLGDAMIRVGTGIAGEAAKAPHVTPDVRPKVGGA